jgi:dipeptidyl aminopeptidase/acylaminoacyl peptidase
MGIVGFSFGGAVAALAAGRDSRIRAGVLAAAPARFGDDDKLKPVAEVTRTRARVLLIWGSRDTQVPVANAERYASVLSQARVTHRTVIIEGGDHDFSPAGPRAMMAQRVAEWCRESLAT